MRFVTDRKRAEGLGSGRHGTHHHWQMIVSSILLVILAPIFVVTFARGYGGSHEEVVAYFGHPLTAIIMALSLVVIIRHLQQEALEAIEDYVHGIGGKLAQVGASAVAYTIMAVGLFAVARLAI